MYTHEFKSYVDGMRLRLNMTNTEAIMERHDSTIIVTGTDTYHVKESYQAVDQAWQDAMNFEAHKNTTNISAI